MFIIPPTLETSSIPTKENFADLETKKLSADRMRYLMHGVGVYDESAGELVGTDVVTRERAADDVRGVLRMLRESIGERSSHKTMVATKRSAGLVAAEFSAFHKRLEPDEPNFLFSV